MLSGVMRARDFKAVSRTVSTDAYRNELVGVYLRFSGGEYVAMSSDGSTAMVIWRQDLEPRVYGAGANPDPGCEPRCPDFCILVPADVIVKAKDGLGLTKAQWDTWTLEFHQKEARIWQVDANNESGFTRTSLVFDELDGGYPMVITDIAYPQQPVEYCRHDVNSAGDPKPCKNIAGKIAIGLNTDYMARFNLAMKDLGLAENKRGIIVGFQNPCTQITMQSEADRAVRMVVMPVRIGGEDDQTAFWGNRGPQGMNDEARRERIEQEGIAK